MVYLFSVQTLSTTQSAEYDKRVANISLFIYIGLPGLQPNSRQEPGSSRQYVYMYVCVYIFAYIYIYIYISCALFADDTTVYASDADMVELVGVFSLKIENISLWMRANALSLNVNKTYYMLCSNALTVPSSDPQIILDGMNVWWEQNCTFLGININTKLNFKFHTIISVGRLPDLLEYFIDCNTIFHKKYW